MASVPIITINGSPVTLPQLAPTSSRSQSNPQTSSSGPRAYDFTYEKYDEYNLIVYQYQDIGVLVQAVPKYEASIIPFSNVGRQSLPFLQDAVDIAIKEFPSLVDVPREDIAICYETASSGRMTYWRISESAWRNSARKFQPRTRLRIAVRGEDKLAGPSTTSKPPPYEPSEGSRARTRSESPSKRPVGPVIAKQKSGSSISSLFKRF